MSKASEWAAQEYARLLALEEARDRIEQEYVTEPGVPLPFMRDRIALARVTHADQHPRMSLATMAGSGGAVWLTADEALNLARWILDTFGEGR